jgi:hypothetical protein
MADINLRQMLRHTVYVDRAEMGMSGLNPLSPQYVRQSGPLPALIQPLRGDLAATVAGRLLEATHVAYLATGPTILAGDFVTQELLVGQLTGSAAAGATRVGVTEEAWGPGDLVEVGPESALERLAVRTTETGWLDLEAALAEAHLAGERVAAVRQYEVLAVEDEGGQGHHLRVVMRG